MDDFDTMRTQVQKREIEKRKQYRLESKERLKKSCITKVRTTMIGALQSIEDNISKLIPKSGSLTNEQLMLQKIYESIRKEILDKGNQQIRNLEEDFSQYEVEWQKFTLKLPVIRRD